MTECEVQEMREGVKALSNPLRLSLLINLISGGEKSVGELMDMDVSGVSQPTISRSLNTLHKAGLVTCRVEHPKTYYQANHESLVRLKELVGGLGS